MMWSRTVGAAAFALGLLLPTSGVVAQVEPPRLVVLVSVDQLAQWVFDQGAPFFADDGGFRRLQREGVTFAQCAYEHACSETGPGHATIGTGAPASSHGIVKNNWWSAVTRKGVYCAADDTEALPELPEGAGRGPGKLLVPTLATSLKAHVRGSKVASVSWKDRSAILMVGEAADAVAWFEASTGNLTTNRAWVDAVPEWIAEFNRRRAIDSFFGKQWQRTGPAAAYAGLVDDRRYEWVHGNGSLQRTLPQPMTGGKDAPEQAYYTQLYASPFGNTVVRWAAEAALAGEQLGKDEVSDLLCVSFSSTDVIGHYFGPESVEARDGLLRLDRELGELFRLFDREVGEGRWAAFVTADHGVGPTPETVRENGVSAGRGPIDAWVKSAVERRLRKTFGDPPEQRSYVARVGEGAVYLDHDTLSERGLTDDVEAVERAAAEAAAKVRGIMSAYTTRELERDARGNGDPLRAALAKSVVRGRGGDVQLIMRPYWINGALPATHGTPHGYDREVIGFAIGPGVPAGEVLAQPITPGFGAVLLAKMLAIPKPAAAHESVPAGLLQLR